MSNAESSQCSFVFNGEIVHRFWIMNVIVRRREIAHEWITKIMQEYYVDDFVRNDVDEFFVGQIVALC